MAFVIERDVAPRLDEKGAVIIESPAVSGQKAAGNGKSKECRPAFHGVDGVPVVTLGQLGHALGVGHECRREQFGQHHDIGVALDLTQRVGGRDDVGLGVGVCYVEGYGADFHAFSGFIPLNGA